MKGNVAGELNKIAGNTGVLWNSILLSGWLFLPPLEFNDEF